jgi:peptide/nickel transport system permease protein
MLTYIIRRIIYAIPILLGVNIITFALFFLVNSPDDMARMHLGTKHVTPAAVQEWKVQHGYNKPLFINRAQSGIKKVTDTLFVSKSLDLFLFDFGDSDQGRSIAKDIKTRMWPSLMLAIPTLLLGLIVNIALALTLSLFRGTKVDTYGVFICVIMMSISALFYIIIGQHLVAKIFKLVPISGYHDGLDAIKFLALPVIIGVLSGIGAATRWYRTIFLAEYSKDYVRTARAKGLSEWQVLRKHVLKSGMIPILTGVVVIIPSLFLGSLIMESFFGIPGLGSYTIDAIAQQDFDIIRVMVFLGTLLYIAGLILTDISYTMVDPRIRFT